LEGKEKLDELLDIMSDMPLYEKQMLLLDYSDRFVRAPAKYSRDKTRQVSHCESGVFVWVDKKESVGVYFDVLNPNGVSARALCAVLQECFDGNWQHILTVDDEEFVSALFGDNVAMGRKQGLISVIRMLQSDLNQLVEQIEQEGCVKLCE
jgi:sulfur transfer protein SufE